MRSVLSERVSALALAAAEISDARTRLEFCEMLLDSLKDLSFESAQICASVLKAQAEGSPAHQMGCALLERVGTYEGKHFGGRPALRVDLMILTVKDVELQAVHAAFSIERTDSVKVAGEEIWMTKVGNVNIAVACIGTAGNIESAFMLTRLWSELRFSAAVLIGMAAGVRAEVDLGDVVVAEAVLGYESVTLHRDRVVPSYHQYPGALADVRRAARPSFTDKSWSMRVSAEVADLSGTDLYRKRGVKRFPKKLQDWLPKVTTGVILAGGKLVEDGSIPELKDTTHGRTKAVEMEGCGFAAVCVETRTRWLVIRGIADFGEPNRRKEWQLTASYAAAALLRDGLGSEQFSFLLD